MDQVQRGMTVTSTAGQFGTITDVSGDQITVQRSNGGTMTLQRGQYTVRDGVVRVRLSSEQDTGEIAIPIVEEELSVGKREVEGGGVRVQTRVEEVPVNEQVTLREEEVHVSRRPINQTVDPSMIDQLQEGTFEVRETDEQAVVSKQARVVEEVVVNKEARERTETIQDTVRRTDVDVDQLQGQTRSTGSSMGSTSSSSTMGGRTSGSMGSSSSTSGQGEGLIERGLSKAENAVERGTGLDLDRDGDTGRRDPGNNVGGI